MAISQTKLLSAIRTYVGVSLVREYRLAYKTSASTGRSLLESVRECAAIGQCLPATAFQWTGFSSSGYFPAFNGSGSGTWSGVSTAHLPADIDGDGRTDLLGKEGDPAGTWYWKACLARESGFSCFTSPGEGNYIDIKLAGDYNGDGLTDVVEVENEPVSEGRGYSVWIKYSTGSGFGTRTLVKWQAAGGTLKTLRLCK